MKYPWTARGNRIYAADGEEILVATKASPKHRAGANNLAAALAVILNEVKDDYGDHCSSHAKFSPGCGTCVVLANLARLP